mmetsp:Transcript_49364/g.148652  ORF Transcript_49364/g.148652 Transcript_49364/m.148652 type:complete len:233 (-) Transcript_49364:861-1559(-)
MRDERRAFRQSVTDADGQAAQFVERFEGSGEGRSSRNDGTASSSESVLHLGPDEFVPHGVDGGQRRDDGLAGESFHRGRLDIGHDQALGDLGMIGGEGTGSREELDESLDGRTTVSELVLHSQRDLLEDARDQYHPLGLELGEIVLEATYGRIDDGASPGKYPQFERTFGDVPHGEKGESAIPRKRFGFVVGLSGCETMSYLMEEIAVGQHDALGTARGSRGVHDGRNIVQT